MTNIAKVVEVFESIQGEGLYMGAQQVFIRFFGCNIACRYCDTPLTHYREVTTGQLAGEISQYSGFHSLALTGGEPLLQADFLKAFLNCIRDLKIRIYLETNGTLVNELAKVLDLVDIISMDFKLPSVCQCGPFWKEHEDFLKTGLEKEIFVKMVIGHDTHDQDIFMARDIIKKLKPGISVVLQPDWYQKDELLLDKMASFRKEFTESGISDVRILPQAHKYAGVK